MLSNDMLKYFPNVARGVYMTMYGVCIKAAVWHFNGDWTL